MKQLRRHPRIHWLVPCYFEIKENKGSERYGWGIIQNISIQGLELETRFPLEIQQTIFLTFDMNVHHVFKNIPGTIVRKKQGPLYSTYGIKFMASFDTVSMENAIASILAPQ